MGQGGTQPEGHIPFTPRAKKVLEMSLREALQLGHNYIGTEHILLGLIREGEGVAAQMLVKLGADLSRVRQQVVSMMSGYSGPDASERDLGPDVWPTVIGEERWLAAQRTLSPRSREVLERALGEALAAGAPEIEPEHLFLALIGEGDGPLSDALRAVGLDPHEIRRRLADDGDGDRAD